MKRIKRRPLPSKRVLSIRRACAVRRVAVRGCLNIVRRTTTGEQLAAACVYFFFCARQAFFATVRSVLASYTHTQSPSLTIRPLCSLRQLLRIQQLYVYV